MHYPPIVLVCALFSMITGLVHTIGNPQVYHYESSGNPVVFQFFMCLFSMIFIFVYSFCFAWLFKMYSDVPHLYSILYGTAWLSHSALIIVIEIYLISGGHRPYLINPLSYVYSCLTLIIVYILVGIVFLLCYTAYCICHRNKHCIIRIFACLVGKNEYQEL